MKRDYGKRIREICFAGLLLCMALTLSFIESTLPGLPFLPAGVKPGFSNIIVMYTLFFMGTKWGFSVAFLKSLFVLFLRGPVGFILSLSGGILSLFVILVLKRIKGLNLVFLSIGGAVAHNIGQITAASFILENIYVWYYLPVLIISGIIMGSVTGISYRIIMPYINGLKRHFN